jgi:hypothetical protein
MSFITEGEIDFTAPPDRCAFFSAMSSARRGISCDLLSAECIEMIYYKQRARIPATVTLELGSPCLYVLLEII